MRFPFIFLCFCIWTSSTYAQGQFAGEKTRSLIGKTFNNDRKLPGLPDYTYRHVTLASDTDDDEQLSVGVFQKGPTYIVFFALNSDTTSDMYTILDVLVVKQVKKNQTVRTLMCGQNKKNNIEIVAVTSANAATAPALRAWRFNREKKQFELLDANGIDCMADGDE